MENIIHRRFWWESQEERDHWEDLDVDGSIILRRVLMKCGEGGVNLIVWLRR
jgi:hypothetical protein